MTKPQCEGVESDSSNLFALERDLTATDSQESPTLKNMSPVCQEEVSGIRYAGLDRKTIQTHVVIHKNKNVRAPPMIISRDRFFLVIIANYAQVFPRVGDKPPRS